MKNDKARLYFGIVSLYIFCLFILIGRWIHANEFPTYEYEVWMGQQAFLVQAAIWLPFVIGVIMLASVFYRRIKEYLKKSED